MDQDDTHVDLSEMEPSSVVKVDERHISEGLPGRVSVPVEDPWAELQKDFELDSQPNSDSKDGSSHVEIGASTQEQLNLDSRHQFSHSTSNVRSLSEQSDLTNNEIPLTRDAFSGPHDLQSLTINDSSCSEDNQEVPNTLESPLAVTASLSLVNVDLVLEDILPFETGSSLENSYQLIERDMPSRQEQVIAGDLPELSESYVMLDKSPVLHESQKTPDDDIVMINAQPLLEDSMPAHEVQPPLQVYSPSLESSHKDQSVASEIELLSADITPIGRQMQMPLKDQHNYSQNIISVHEDSKQESMNISSNHQETSTNDGFYSQVDHGIRSIADDLKSFSVVDESPGQRITPLDIRDHNSQERDHLLSNYAQPYNSNTAPLFPQCSASPLIDNKIHSDNIQLHIMDDNLTLLQGNQFDTAFQPKVDDYELNSYASKDSQSSFEQEHSHSLHSAANLLPVSASLSDVVLQSTDLEPFLDRASLNVEGPVEFGFLSHPALVTENQNTNEKLELDLIEPNLNFIDPNVEEINRNDDDFDFDETAAMVAPGRSVLAVNPSAKALNHVDAAASPVVPFEQRISLTDQPRAVVTTGAQAEAKQRGGFKGDNIDDAIKSELSSDPFVSEADGAKLGATKEWDELPTVEPVVDGENGTRVLQAEVSRSSTLIAYCEALEYLRKNNLLEQYKATIVPTVSRSRFSRLLFFCCRPEVDSSLVADRDLVFCIAACMLLGHGPFQNDNLMHCRVLQTIYRLLTGAKVDCPRFGSHWEDIGFQGVDPATDLRSVGFLGLLHLLYLLSDPKTVPLARAIYKLSLHHTQNFPFAVMSINLTRTALVATREGCLNKEYNKAHDVIGVLNAFYAGTFRYFYDIWLHQHKTICDTGFVLADVEAYVKKHPAEVISSISRTSPKLQGPTNAGRSPAPGIGFTNLDEIND